MLMQHFVLLKMLRLLQPLLNHKHGMLQTLESRSVCSGDRLFMPMESQLQVVESVLIQWRQDLVRQCQVNPQMQSLVQQLRRVQELVQRLQ
jgi:hypothetical protein